MNGADTRFCLLTLHTACLQSQLGLKYMNNSSKTALRVTSQAFYHLICVKLASYHIRTEL